LLCSEETGGESGADEERRKAKREAQRTRRIVQRKEEIAQSLSRHNIFAKNLVFLLWLFVKQKCSGACLSPSKVK